MEKKEVGTIAVTFFSNSYAPGMVQVEAVDPKITKEIIEDITLVNDGVNPLGGETTALISYEDAEYILSEGDYKELNSTGIVTVDYFDDLRALYGYCSD